MSGLHDPQYMKALEDEMNKVAFHICIGIGVNPTDEYPDVPGYLGLLFVTQATYSKYSQNIEDIPRNKLKVMYITRDPEWNDSGHVDVIEGEIEEPCIL
tara:strand:+ start:9469 stop:9765 length:297 start_codon:yes stop_codon:yes gene_type:complete